jgi:hypothetical protein
MSNLNALKNAIAAELDRASKERKPEISAELMTTLITSLAMVTSVHCRGDREAISNCLEGAINLLFEEASRLRKFGEFMGAAR